MKVHLQEKTFIIYYINIFIQFIFLHITYKCVDCYSKYPMFISINNAVLLCVSCAKKHLQYGYNVSYIRSINDKYDMYLLNYIQRGGNERYLRYCEDSGLNTLNSEERYNTYGMEYYRVLVCIYIC